MNLPLNYDTPNGFSLSEYPHGSGTPVFSSPEWTDIQLAEDYQVTFHKIGSHILSAYPKGKITYEGTCALFDAYDKFLQASGLSRSSFVEISDYSGIVNLPSKRARFEVAERLLEKTKQNNLIGHFVYNVPKHIKWIYNIGIRLKQPGIPMMAVDTYKEALDQALRLKTNKAGTQGMIPQAENDLDLKRTSPEHIQDILDYLGSINWDEAGMREENIPESHPLKPVFNAIAILKADHDATRDEREKIQEKYKHLFNRISDPILVFDKNTQKILDWNQAFLSTYGFSQEELVTMTPKHLHPLEELDRVNRNIGKHAPGKIGRYTHVTKSGESMDVEIRTDETDYQGRSAWISTIRDITEQNRLEKELRRHRDALEGVVKKRTRALEQEIADRKQTETKFKTLFDLNADAVLLLDKNGFIDCNQAALDLFGCTSKEELSDLGLGGISPKFQENGRISEPLARENLGLAFELGTNQFEWIHLNNKTRRTFPADVVLHRMTLDGKDVLQAIVRDITQRRESEEALRQSEEKYRGMIENMQDVFFRTDLSWNLTMISPSGLSLLGYGSDTQILGQNIGKLFFNKSQEFDRFKENLNTYGNVRYFELDLITRENEIIPVISSCTLYTDALDTPHGIEGTITNIKAQKEAEDTLRLAKRQAESAAKTKSDFLANMSHEIRTPLNAILGMAELVRETELNDYQKNLMTTINTEASSLLGIINSILDFSKVEAGRMELETTPFNLRVLFEDLATSFAVTAHRKELEFISFLSPDTPEQLVGDPGRIRQVLVNLVGNAIKFTQDGEIFIWVDLLEDTKERVSLRFNVKDTGIGIPKDKQDYIFESFAQADGSTTRKYGGTGLGTAISKELVTLMNGRIGVESEHGKGALFWFTIPLAKHIEQKTAPRFQEPAKVLSGRKVLVVSPNPNSRFVFCSHLKAWGCLPDEAQNALEALVNLNEAPKFDLVLSDLHMEGMDGFELVRQIRHIPEIKNTPVILLTSLGRVGDNRKCRDLDIQGYLLKPIKQQALKTAVTTVLSPSSQATPTPVTRHTITDIRRKKVQILLAEDYPANQQVAVRHLMSRGYQVSLAKNGQQAVDLFKAKQFNLVLMDIQMPVMDGYEATRQIRIHEEKTQEAWNKANPDSPDIFRSTPIIAMTAHAIKGYKDKCLAHGMDDFMTKPLQKEAFLNMIDGYLEGRGNQEQIQPSHGKKASKSVNAESVGISAGDPLPEYPMDLDKALSEFDNDVPFLLELLDNFFSSVTSQFALMDKAFKEKDFKFLQENAHSIKGGAANLRADNLASAALALEDLSKLEREDGLASAMDKLLFEFARLINFSKELKDDIHHKF